MVRLAFVQREIQLSALQHWRPVALAGGLSNSLLSGVRDVSMVIQSTPWSVVLTSFCFLNMQGLNFSNPDHQYKIAGLVDAARRASWDIVGISDINTSHSEVVMIAVERYLCVTFGKVALRAALCCHLALDLVCQEMQEAWKLWYCCLQSVSHPGRAATVWSGM